MQAFLLLSAPTMSGLRPPLSATKKYLTVFFLAGAGGESRTLVLSLGRIHNSRYTTPA